MTRRVRYAVALSLWASATFADSEFWNEKDHAAWSKHEAQAVLTNSPWAQTAVIFNPNFNLAARVGGLSGGVVGQGVASRRGFGGGGGGVGGDGAGNLGGGSFLAPPERINVAVRWSSARPVKLALARLQSLGKLLSDSAVNPAGEEPFYRISMVGLPLRAFATTASELDPVTLLKRQNASSIEPLKIHFEHEGELLTIEFQFSKADPITAAHHEVEFVTKLGDSVIKKKFRLRDMIFRGTLEL